MPRSVKKGPYIDKKLRAKIKKAELENDRRIIRTWARNSTIPPEFVGFTLAVHNGRKFMTVHISENMVGHKLGEFAPTRTYHGHAADRKNAKKVRR